MKKMMEKNTVEERKGNLTEEDQKKEICDAEKQQEKLRFECDYLEGAVPEIMQRLMETNLVQTPGYSEDVYCESAREKPCTLRQGDGRGCIFWSAGRRRI